MRGGEKCASEGVPICAGWGTPPLAASVHAYHPPQMHATARSGWCTNLRVSYDRHAHSVRRGGRKQGVRCPAASKAAVVKIDWNSAIIRRSVSMRGMITSW